jgi:hypothetical protein
MLQSGTVHAVPRVSARLALLAACACACALADAPRPHFTLGVLRADGLLLPFASYDGRWSVPWPTSLRSLTLPIYLRDVNDKWWGAAGPDAPWTAVFPDGTKQPLHLEGLQQTRIFCTPRLGVQTNHRGAPPAPDDPTVAKDALAIAGDATLLPIEHVATASPDWSAMAKTIAKKFDDAEDQAADGFTKWKHPFNDKERHAYPINLEAFYRSAEQTRRGAWRVSYVEAVRRFPARPEDNGCGLITYASGWILERDGHEPRIALQARVAFCDRNEVPFIQPFGRIVVEDEVYWVYQVSSWSDEAYAVARVRPADVDAMVVAVGGSDCSRER